MDLGVLHQFESKPAAPFQTMVDCLPNSQSFSHYVYFTWELKEICEYTPNKHVVVYMLNEALNQKNKIWICNRVALRYTYATL